MKALRACAFAMSNQTKEENHYQFYLFLRYDILLVCKA